VLTSRLGWGSGRGAGATVRRGGLAAAGRPRRPLAGCGGSSSHPRPARSLGWVAFVAWYRFAGGPVDTWGESIDLHRNNTAWTMELACLAGHGLHQAQPLLPARGHCLDAGVQIVRIGSAASASSMVDEDARSGVSLGRSDRRAHASKERLPRLGAKRL
jgi:hypothetical protein